jgi:predicted metal-binding membrane protein
VADAAGALYRRQRWLIGGCLALMAALAWAWLLHDAAEMKSAADMAAMPGMPASGPVRFSDYTPSAFVMWFLMMIAMMAPSALPMVLLYGKVAGQTGAKAGVVTPTAVFVSAYFAVWCGFSLLAAIAQWALVRQGALSAFTLAVGDRRIAGALLIAAGLYQLTPLKRMCLDACRSPLSFLMRLWRPGRRGAWRLGLRHGLYCLGCCWPTMLLLFVGGVMSLAWIAVLAVVVLIEKLAPAGRQFGVIAGAGAIAAGAVLALGHAPA